LKNRRISLLFPPTLPHGSLEGEMTMNSSGLECEANLVHVKGIIRESGWI